MKRDEMTVLIWILIGAIVAGMLFAFISDGLAEPVRCKIVQAGGGLKVRTAPNLDGNVVYLLDNTETVVVFEERNGWYRVGKNIPPHVELGWVCGEYLR